MDGKRKKLPGKVWRVLSFIPALNWISLLYIGIVNSNKFCIICGAIYGVITYTNISLSTFIWILGVIHYAIAYSNVKRQMIEYNVYREMAENPFQQKNVNKDVEKEYFEGLFSEIEIPGDVESKQTIPVRPSHIQERISVTFSANNPKGKFLDDMRKYESKEGQKVPFVPFMTYWPTYDSMEKSQQAWYFYWRSQVRRDNYIDTDLSYVFVYIYELLSEIGWEAPQDGLLKLYAVWTEYRERFPKLDNYMPGWIFDFAQLHDLDFDIPFDKGYVHLAPSVMTDVLIDRHREEAPLKLSFSLIDALTDYVIVNSKFYKDGNQELMQEAIPRVVALADAILRKKKQKGILTVYGPSRTKKQERFIFSSAVCPQASEKITVTVKGYSTYARLRAYLNELVRYGENILRSIKGYRGRLRGITLDEKTEKLIEEFLRKEYGKPKEKSDERVSPKEIVLDFDSINSLRKQSDAVRSALEVDEADMIVEKPLLTDVEEVTAVYLSLSSGARELLDRLEKSKWEIGELPEDEKFISEINRLAERYLGCMILVREGDNILAEDDYRDELEYIYKNPPQISERDKEHERFDPGKLSAELKEFVEALMPEQSEALYTILTSEAPQTGLQRISEEMMTMPEILLDDINALSMQLLGDIIIDTMGQEPAIMDEYYDPLKKSII